MNLRMQLIMLILFIQAYYISSNQQINTEYTYNNDISIQNLLNKISIRLQSGKKYALFTPDGSGFGNLARGMSATLALALISNRKFVVETSSSYFQLFSEPSNIFSIKKSSTNFGKFKRYPQNLLILGKPTSAYATSIEGSLKSNHDYIEHHCGCSFAQYFYTNQFKDIWREIFDMELRWDEIDVLLVMWLFQNPKAVLINNANKVLDSINWHNYTEHVVVQYRGFIDVASKNGKTFNKDVQLITKQVHMHQSHLDISQRDNILIYVTSDSFTWSKLLKEHLKKSFRNVEVSDMFPNTHSAKASLSALTSTQGMIDWIILGIAKDVICTGTTYCISARARVGMGSPYWYDENNHHQIPASNSLSSIVSSSFSTTTSQSQLQTTNVKIRLGRDAPFDNYTLNVNNTLYLFYKHKFLAMGGTTVRYQLANDAHSIHDNPPYNGQMTAANQPLPWFYLHL